MARKKATVTRRKANPKHERPRKMPAVQKKTEKMLEEAESLINAFDYESAKECCKNILSLDSNNVKAMDILAGILVDEGDFAEAENLYLHCVEISPDDSFERYFSLAQINQGKTSLEFYEKGIAVIKKMLENAENSSVSVEPTVPALKRAMSDAYCSMADLYTTDLCLEDDAEESCKKHIEEAETADPDNPDVYRCYANYHISKCEEEAAVEMIKKSLSLWLPYHEALRDKAEIDPESQVSIPEYASRVNTSKLLIELQLFEEASKVLEGLLEENDQDFYVWYLLGWSNFIHGDDYKGNAYFYLEKAKEVGMKHGVEDEDLLKQTEELLEELKEYAGDDEECDKENYQPLDISSSDDDEEENCNEEVDMEL